MIILPKTVGVINNLKQYPTEAKIDLNVMINDLSSTFAVVESAFIVIKKHPINLNGGV